MFMWYKHGNYHDCLDAVEVSFHFSNQFIFGEGVTACGIRLLYRQDAEELNINNDLGKLNVVKTGAVNFDTGEPYAKRTKLSIPSDSADHASPYNMAPKRWTNLQDWSKIVVWNYSIVLIFDAKQGPSVIDTWVMDAFSGGVEALYTWTN
ncbi:hypothetical protein TIFTF001_029591 [Ficus carica]|uniref:Uncharacterized protein n=1 Tax=Ficus carica TaxID=3494 RepID=A0AA88J3K9_FICCA|nr:hypothetical protein TIFTF001_029591 [Ficus carica]